ncbi:MAG: TonB-dependent receptor [Porticoccaceae bacterium]
MNDKKIAAGKMATLLMSIFGISEMAMAQANTAGTRGIEEIIVTAQKRAENLQDVPITISALGGSILQDSVISKTDDLSMVIPGMQMTRQIGASQPFLRGVGTQNGAAGDESSISTYVDGVYTSSMFAAVQNFNSIERIEVLKGPQGTLFGRNATGGLMHIITKDPQHDFSANLRASYGSYETLTTNFYATNGLTDNIAADIALSYVNQGEGFGKNLITGNDSNKADIHSRAVRNSWLIDFSENTQGRLSLDYAERKENTVIARQLAPGSIGADGVTTYTGEFYNVEADIDAFTRARSWGASLKLTHNFDMVDFVSISGYRSSNTFGLLDQDSTPLNLIRADLKVESEFFSQELQLLSTYESKLQWVIGLYYMNETSKYNPFKLSGLGISGSTGAEAFLAYPVQDSQSYAAFAQGNYAITQKTNITAGIRFTRDERELVIDRHLDFGSMNVPLPQITGDESWVEPTWRLSIDHRISEEIMVFGSYSRGFKSGVYNTSGALDGAVGPVDPEILDAFEIGIKATLLDNRVHFNASAFYYDYTDMQLTQIFQGTVRLLNAAEAEILGAELDVIALVADNLELRFGLSVLDTEYTKFPGMPVATANPAGGNIVGVRDGRGNDLIRAPDYTVNLGGSYTIPIETGRIAMAVNYYYNDGFFWEPENRLKQDSYSLLNAELSWSTLDERLKLSFFGKNLTDDKYSYQTSSGSFGDFVTAAAPRTGGVAVEYSF